MGDERDNKGADNIGQGAVDVDDDYAEYEPELTPAERMANRWRNRNRMFLVRDGRSLVAVGLLLAVTGELIAGILSAISYSNLVSVRPAGGLHELFGGFGGAGFAFQLYDGALWAQLDAIAAIALATFLLFSAQWADEYSERQHGITAWSATWAAVMSGLATAAVCVRLGAGLYLHVASDGTQLTTDLPLVLLGLASLVFAVKVALRDDPEPEAGYE